MEDKTAINITLLGTPIGVADRSRLVVAVCEQYKSTIITGPVHLNFMFYFPIPKSAGPRVRRDMLNGKIAHTDGPDYDDLEKFYCDVMTGHIWVDDAQVITCVGVKLYAEQPRVEVCIEPATWFGVGDHRRRFMVETSLAQSDIS